MVLHLYEFVDPADWDAVAKVVGGAIVFVDLPVERVVLPLELGFL